MLDLFTLVNREWNARLEKIRDIRNLVDDIRNRKNNDVKVVNEFNEEYKNWHFKAFTAEQKKDIELMTAIMI